MSSLLRILNHSLHLRQIWKSKAKRESVNCVKISYQVIMPFKHQPHLPAACILLQWSQRVVRVSETSTRRWSSGFETHLPSEGQSEKFSIPSVRSRGWSVGFVERMDAVARLKSFMLLRATPPSFASHWTTYESWSVGLLQHCRWGYFPSVTTSHIACLSAVLEVMCSTQRSLLPRPE